MTQFAPYYTIYLLEVKRARAWRLHSVFIRRDEANFKRDDLQSKYPRNEYRIRCAHVEAPR